MGKIILRGFIIALVGLVLLAAAWTWVTLNWTYSEGERAGYIQKFSRKGWLCKTWEGEVAMVTMPGAIPEKFEFSVRDDAVAARINALAGNRMVLHYQQHKFVPSSCFAETEYFVVDVQPVVDNAGIPQQRPVSPMPQLPGTAMPSLPGQSMPTTR
ncbi:MAG: hypothetical protein P4L70_10195 [Parasulfuritortus sp.]|nr:hypothetical protein [Parasulfuritortus sp.]